MSTSPGPPNLEHRHLRSALQFAVDVADAGQRLKPPLTSPPELRPFLRQPRVSASALGRIRRIVDGDDDFRRRLAAAVTDELVDPIGREWLRRDDGWEQRIATLVDAATSAAAEHDAATALKRAERRRQAAEEQLVRTRAELVQLTGVVADLRARLADGERRASGVDAAIDALREELAAARREARHVGDRAEAARARTAVVELERDDARQRVAEAERQRDELLAARAELSNSGVTAGRLGELRSLAAAAAALAARMAALVDVPTAKRSSVALPGDVARDPRRSTEHLLRTAGVVVLIDGYNVAKLTWPELDLADQRERLLDAVDSVARRYPAELVVVFDGASVPGGHARRRRLARVRFSPSGVSADDVIRAEVSAADASRPVMVVTNDVAIRRDVGAAGANVVASEAFAAVALS